MSYLIIRDYNSGKILRSVRRATGTMCYREILQILEQTFNGATFYSPLESAPRGSRIVSVYVSPNKQGVGRIECNFELWGVIVVDTGKVL